MNKSYLYIIALVTIVALVPACLPENNMETPTTEEKGILAFDYSPITQPLKTDSGYLFINNDYSLVHISNKGYNTVLNDFSALLTNIEQVIEDGGNVEFQRTSLQNEYIIRKIVKNAAKNDFVSTEILKISDFGNISAYFYTNIQSVDSINTQDTIYEREFISANIQDTIIWIAFSLSIDRMPQQRKTIEFLVYNLSDSLLLDTIVTTNSNQKPLKIIQDKGSIRIFLQEFKPQGPILSMKTINSNFEIIDSAFFNFPASEIYYLNFLSNNNYLIAGLETQFINNVTSQINFVAEISPQGELIFHKNDFSYNYLFFYDVLKTTDGYLSCGLYSINQTYPAWNQINNLTGTAYFLGFFNAANDSLIMANTTNYGTSLSVGLHKTDNGYTLLNYMSFIDDPLKESYIWLYKLNNDFKIN